MTALKKYMKFSGFLALLMLFALAGCNDDDDGGLTTAEQFEFETQKIDAYISSNGLMTSTDPNSAMRYEVTSIGTGLAVAFVTDLRNKVADSVTISYTAKLLDTEETVLTVTNEKIAYEDLVIGVRVALQFVQEGGSIQFFLPSAYAYGRAGSGDIPANATLIYDLDLIEVEADQLRTDIQEIDDFLAENSLGAIKHPTGLRFTIDEPGTGPIPTLFNIVVVDYNGRLMENGFEFDSGNSVGFLLQELITGWQIGLQQVRAGGSVTLYVPSTMAYGSTGVPPEIPANAQLVFIIDLIAVQG